MPEYAFPVIDLPATGANIRRLRQARGLTVRDLQRWFGFEEPQAIYKWQRGQSLPAVENLYALSVLLDVPMNEILIPTNAQQASACCPSFCAKSRPRLTGGGLLFSRTRIRARGAWRKFFSARPLSARLGEARVPEDAAARQAGRLVKL